MGELKEKDVALIKHYEAVCMKKRNVETKEDYIEAKSALQRFYDKKKFLSLSAAQIGIDLKMIAVAIDGKLKFLANPMIFIHGNRRSMVYENDLTSEFEGYVSRPRKCHIVYLNEDMKREIIKPKREEKDGILHAMDYIGNVSYVSNINKRYQNNIKEILVKIKGEKKSNPTLEEVAKGETRELKLNEV